MSELGEHHVQFFTAVCKDWLHLLSSDKVKEIIISALKYRISLQQIKLCVYVIMPNHLHFIWRIQKSYKREEVQRDFLKFTSREILKFLKLKESALYNKLLVDVKTGNIRYGKEIQ